MNTQEYFPAAPLSGQFSPMMHLCCVVQYACDVQAEVVGKPSAEFFQTVLSDMKLQPHQVVMIGDDLLNDVGGAQRCGMKGLQVRTGKYRPSDEQHPSVRADAYMDDLSAAVNAILTDH